MGGSNGGLLVGAVMAQRPDLFGAVVCQVPLLDMIAYYQDRRGRVMGRRIRRSGESRPSATRS